MIRRAFRLAVSVPRRLFKFTLFAAALAGGGFLALAAFHETVDGSGVPATEDRNVGSIRDVELSGVGELTITQGDVPALSVTADDNILPLLETETSGRKLTLRTKSDYSLRTKTKIAYALTVPNLEQLTVSGAGNARAEKLTGDRLAVRLSGAGTVTLREDSHKSLTLTLSGAGHATLGGTAESVTLKVSGAGDIDAASLQAKAADVQVSGAGTVRLWATDELKARVSGAGGVRYKGSPKVEPRVSGAGSVKPL